MTKAVALLSGGLDSTLAVKLMVDQGIEVHALNFTSVFCTCDGSAKKQAGCKGQAAQVAERFGVPIKVVVKGLDYIDIVRNPRFGYGKGVNPCVDCRIYLFKAAKKYMEEIGASFVITGEVIGQRPMSQRRDSIATIERESGLEGLVLRPLSAKVMEPTIPEKDGTVDREKLMDVTGRGRRVQMDKADDLGVGDYPCPAGGCLLTDKIFAKKVRDLFDNKEDITVRDLQLLKCGRHFRVEGTKVIIGRDAADNTRLKNLTGPGDSYLEPVDFAGPAAFVESGASEKVRSIAAGLIGRYAGDKAPEGAVVRGVTDGVEQDLAATEVPGEQEIREYMVCSHD